MPDSEGMKIYPPLLDRTGCAGGTHGKGRGAVELGPSTTFFDDRKAATVGAGLIDPKRNDAGDDA